jgi:shikimate kinase
MILLLLARMILKLVRTPGIYLVGFMGSGKTTIGERLAERLGWIFVDLDREIESEQHMAIAEIFETAGEERFRAIETEAMAKHLKQVRSGRPLVMALGGGAFARPENIELLDENGVTIWLDCPLETVRARIGEAAERPLARDPKRFEELYGERREFYTRADFRIDASACPDAVVDAICKLPLF